jgi:tetratricopeptide (TPR) repeat protein
MVYDDSFEKLVFDIAGTFVAAIAIAVLFACLKWKRQREAEATAQHIRLLDADVAEDILRKDAEAVAKRLVQKADLEAGGAANVSKLRAIQDKWYQRGQEESLHFDLAVAIALSTLTLPRANGPDDRGTILNDLYIALLTLGEREAGTVRLEQAVEACRAALAEVSQDREPLKWAAKQMNLGNSLATFGKRDAGTDHLEQAVDAYRATLSEHTQERVPLDWAATQHNLGAVLGMLGERSIGTERLEQAVAAFRAALTEWKQGRAPQEWTMAQMNLGIILATIGYREGGTARLEQAVDAFRAALTERKQDREPQDWAATQHCLGSALAMVGERETGTARLEQAVVAYRAALTERTRDRAPLDWANTLGNEGRALLTLAGRTGDLARARQALEQVTLAEATLRSGGHMPWAETFARQIPAAQALADRLSAGQP